MRSTQTDKRISSANLVRTCPVCGGNRTRPFLAPPKSPGPVVKCETCGFVFVNPITATRALIEKGPGIGRNAAHLLTSANLDAIKGSWEEPLLESGKSEFPAKRLNAKDALHRLAKYAKTRGTLLDLGCGTGLFLSVAAQEGWDCYGIEPLAMHSIFARGYFGLRVVTDTLSDETYPPEFFDAVTSFQVFEHLIHPDEELEKIKRILVPHGHVLIEVPNIASMGVKLLGGKHRHFVQDHVSFFSARTLSDMLERHGFTVQEVYYPTRIMSLRHLNMWLVRSGAMGSSLQKNLPPWLHEKFVRLNLRDIVAVIGKKI